MSGAPKIMSLNGIYADEIYETGILVQGYLLFWILKISRIVYYVCQQGFSIWGHKESDHVIMHAALFSSILLRLGFWEHYTPWHQVDFI